MESGDLRDLRVLRGAPSRVSPARMEAMARTARRSSDLRASPELTVRRSSVLRARRAVMARTASRSSVPPERRARMANRSSGLQVLLAKMARRLSARPVRMGAMVRRSSVPPVLQGLLASRFKASQDLKASQVSRSKVSQDLRVCLALPARASRDLLALPVQPPLPNRLPRRSRRSVRPLHAWDLRASLGSRASRVSPAHRGLTLRCQVLRARSGLRVHPASLEVPARPATPSRRSRSTPQAGRSTCSSASPEYFFAEARLRSCPTRLDRVKG